MKPTVQSTTTENLPVGILELDLHREIVYCNQYASKLLAEPSAQVVGNLLGHYLTPASKILIETYVYPMLLNESQASEVQLTLKLTDGQRSPVVANVALQNNNSSVWSFMACDNRNKLYDELLGARDVLGNQADELNKLNDKIQRENDSLQVFCQSLSHDFTSPMRTVRQVISHVMGDLQSKSSELSEEFNEELSALSLVDNKVMSLMDLSKGLLEFLSVDQQKSDLKIVDLNSVVGIALDLCVSQYNTLIDVEKEYLPCISGNESQLQIAFKNLIGNSLKYNEKPPKITISCDSVSRVGFNTIAVKDNGIGMSPKHLKRIFEPFKRLHSTDKYSGSGLGLSIVHKLVDRHDGEIRVESTPGEGSTFFLTFPCVEG